MDRQTELERFKLDIPLPVFAAGEFGYVYVPKKSSPNSTFMHNPKTGSKIAIQRNAKTRDWTYWSVTNSSSDRGGSIIDLVQYRTADNLGQVRKRLRPWLGGSYPSSRPVPADVPRDVTPTLPDVLEARKHFATTTRPLSDGHHDYLNNSRMLHSGILNRRQFCNAVFTGQYGNAVFPHRDRSGLTGCELRNSNFQGFSKHGYKSLWFAMPGQEEMNALVISEAAIDALSYAALFYEPGACYASTGGQCSELQRDLIRSAIAKLPAGGMVTLAVDADKAGDAIAATLADLFNDVGRDELELKIHQPTTGKDWNDELQASSRKTPLVPSSNKANSLGL